MKRFLSLLARLFQLALLPAGFVFSVVTPAGAAAVPPGPRPNIVVILADDLGWADAGFQDRVTGGRTPLRTPHLDALAAGGTVFSQGYANCGVCSPTRAALLTGRYQTRFGFEFLPPAGGPAYGLPPGEITLPEILRRHGYATGMVGKWHLGSAPGQLPHQRGFEFFHGFLGAAHHYFPSGPQSRPFRPSRIQENDRLAVPFDKYLTDHFGDVAAAFIEKHQQHPFFLYLPFNAVHTASDPAGLDPDMQATDADKALFPNLPPMRQEMAAVVFALDRAVGHVVATLDRLGLRERTVIFFASDNGGRPRWGANNGPLRDGKGSLYEGGIRVPFFTTGPGIPGGTISDVPVATMDLFPTVLAVAGAPLPADRTIDGVDLLPLLRAPINAPARRLLWQFGDASPGAFSGLTVRDGPWKLVEHGRRATLYHLREDIGEHRDLSAEKPGIFRDLSLALAGWAAQQAKPMWTSQFPDGRPPGTTLRPSGFFLTHCGRSGPWSGPGAWTAPSADGPRAFSLMPLDVHPGNTLRFPVGERPCRATNDVTRRGGLPHVLNSLEFCNSGSAAAASGIVLDGAPLHLTTSAAGAPPRLVTSATANASGVTARIENDLAVLANTLHLDGDGTVPVDLAGAIIPPFSAAEPVGLVKSGTGTFVLTGGRSPAFAGAAHVRSGRLVLVQTAAPALTGSIKIGDDRGLAGTAILEVRTANQLASTANVLVTAAGTLHLAASQQLGSLDCRGTLRLDTAELAVARNLTFAEGSSFVLASTGGTVSRINIGGELAFATAQQKPRLRVESALPRGRHVLLQASGAIRGMFSVDPALLPSGHRLERAGNEIVLVVE